MSAADVKAAWAAGGEGCGWNPLAALKLASTTRWLVDGVIPANSIVWMAGAPACGKTFAMLEIAACVSSGRDWMGRQCDHAAVVYVAAEGGTDIHVRRAAAELAAGKACHMRVVQARPQIADKKGLETISALLDEVRADWRCEKAPDTLRKFMLAQLRKHSDYDIELAKKSLTKEEQEAFESLAKLGRARTKRDGLTERMADGRLTDDEVGRLSDVLASTRREIKTLETQLQPMVCEVGQETDLEEVEIALEDWAWGLALDRQPQHVIDILTCRFWRLPPAGTPSDKILLVIDTYSQTAADDTKAIVSQYIKNLRGLIEQVEQQGGVLSVVVIDHLNKSGESYMGALAKQGDSDAMIEVTRRGQLVTLSCPDKMKTARPFDPIHLEMVPYELEGYPDTQGRPLTSLVMKDGTKTQRTREVTGTNNETAPATVLGLLGGEDCTLEDLRARFIAHPSNEGKKADSVRRTFTRALKTLTTDEIVQVVDGVVSLPIA
jgi:RecA/RadA recombinase